MPVDRLRPATRPSRQEAGDVGGLTASITAHGVVQPLVVRPDASRPGAYEIVAGARRFQAARAAGLDAVPVVVRSLADVEALELSLVENLQREDLPPLDEAAGYRRLIEEFGRTQEQVASLVGRSRSHVANTLRLLHAPEEIKGLLAEGALSAGHARALLGAEDPVALAHAVVADGLNVRATERLATAPATAIRTRPTPRAVAAGARRIAA